MASAQIFTDGNFQGVGTDGLVVPNGKLYIYDNATGLLATTYQDSAQTITNVNPVILSASGKAKVFLAAGTYDITLKTSAEVTVWTLNDYIADDVYSKAESDAILSARTVGTIAALRTTAYSGQPFVSVTGYTTALDNIGVREFNWDATSTEADNGGTIIQVTGVVTGRWKMKYSGAVNAKVFGVIGDGVTNTQTAMQAAWDWAYANDCQLEIDKGKYLVDTITFPPALPADTRGNAFKVIGAGAGNAFVINPPTNACTFIGSGNAPILRYVNRLAPTVNTGGAWNVRGIRFQANSSTAPAVLLDMIGEYSFFGECEIYQAGDGDGLQIDYLLKANIERINILNKHYVSPVGTVRVGAGVRIKSGASGGIPTLKKITSRGFLSGYIIGENADSTHNMSGLKMEQCESSVVGIGIDIRPYTLKATIDTCYFEGIENTHIKDQGTMTLITGGIHYYNGNATGVVYYDANYATYGNTFIGNYLETNSNNDVLVKVNGNYKKTVRSNHLLYAGTTKTGIIGIAIYGVNPSVDISANAFLPRGNWLGSGTSKISKLYTGDLTGSIEAQNGNDYSCDTHIGAIHYVAGQSTITESSVTGNLLTLIDGVNYFTMTPNVAISINQIIATNGFPQEIIFHPQNANVTFTNSAYVKMAGGVSFTGLGMITFIVKKIGASYYAYEKSRVTHV